MEEEGGGRGEKEERHFLVFLAPSPLQAPHRSPCQASPPQGCRPGGNGEGGEGHQGGEGGAGEDERVLGVQVPRGWPGGGFESGAKG